MTLRADWASLYHMATHFMYFHMFPKSWKLLIVVYGCGIQPESYTLVLKHLNAAAAYAH